MRTVTNRIMTRTPGSLSLRNHPNSEAFIRSFHREHLEEASFLYEYRFNLFDDPEINWQEIEDPEERFEPHIYALVAGEELSLDVCKKQAVKGDFGELHAAVCVFCRQDRLDLVLDVLDALDPEDEVRVQAVTDALNHELPMSWHSEFIRILLEGDRKLVPLIAKVIGCRRLTAGKELLGTLDITTSKALTAIIWALGRLREQSARGLLLSYLHHEDETICSAAVLALLRIGEQETMNECLRYVDLQNWPLVPLGLGGGRSTVPILLKRAAQNKASGDCLIALGLLGDVSAIDALLSELAHEELGEAAAIALNLITGVALYEEVFIPEEIDEDELFEEELEKLKKGESLYLPVEEPGTTITRISQKPEDWQKWWSENKSRFNLGIRYRNGQPYSPACLLENLGSEKSPHKVRQLVYEELVIRYGIDFPFETEMFVAQQKQAIAQYVEWIKSYGSRFPEGTWYFAGQLMP
jgi:uncharacterized protein (TIGR02270 family)